MDAYRIFPDEFAPLDLSMIAQGLATAQAENDARAATHYTDYFRDTILTTHVSLVLSAASDAPRPYNAPDIFRFEQASVPPYEPPKLP